jgi:hypothetical protein
MRFRRAVRTQRVPRFWLSRLRGDGRSVGSRVLQHYSNEIFDGRHRDALSPGRASHNTESGSRDRPAPSLSDDLSDNRPGPSRTVWDAFAEVVDGSVQVS